MNTTLSDRFRRTTVLTFLFLTATFAHAEQLRDWTALPDFTALRMEVGASPEFAANCGIAGRADDADELEALFGEADWAGADKWIENRLDRCPVDIEMHELRAVVLERLGREDEAGIHIDWYRGLVESILASGDGRTSATPFVTISIAEEYSVIRAFGFTASNQSLTDDAHDLFTVVDENGQEYQMYFFPELHWKRLQQLFPDPPDSME